MTRIKTVLLATVLATASAPAFAQDPGPERSMFQGLLSGLGLLGEDRPPIDYRERAPLVIPRNNALPSPQDVGAARGGNWPNDPDVARARAAGREERAPIIRDDRGRTLTNGELRSRQGGLFGGGPVDATGVRSEAQIAGPATATEMGVRPIWSQVGSMFGGARENDVVPFPGEPTRRRLVEPPPGYRTASPDAPYGPVGRRPNDPQAAYNRQTTGGQDPAAGTGR